VAARGINEKAPDKEQLKRDDSTGKEDNVTTSSPLMILVRSPNEAGK